MKSANSDHELNRFTILRQYRLKENIGLVKKVKYVKRVILSEGNVQVYFKGNHRKTLSPKCRISRS